MTKQKFMRSLKKALFFELPKQELNDVLQEYEAYFKKGLTQGKTEETLVAELGSISLVKTEVLSAAAGGQATTKSRLLLSALLLCVGVLFLYFLSSMPVSWMFKMVFILLLPMACLAILGITKLFRRRSASKKGIFWGYLSVTTCTSVSLLLMNANLSMLRSDTQQWSGLFSWLNGAPIESIGPFVHSFYSIIALVSLLLSLLFLFFTVRDSLVYSPLFILCNGLTMHSISCLQSLRMLATVEVALQVFSEINQILLWSGCFALFALVAALLLRRTKA